MIYDNIFLWLANTNMFYFTGTDTGIDIPWLSSVNVQIYDYYCEINFLPNVNIYL